MTEEQTGSPQAGAGRWAHSFSAILGAMRDPLRYDLPTRWRTARLQCGSGWTSVGFARVSLGTSSSWRLFKSATRCSS